MNTIQLENTATDMLVARDFKSLNLYEKSLVSEARNSQNPRLAVENAWLCSYHPEVTRLLSMSNRALLELIENDTTLPAILLSSSSFEIIW